ncbi:MAG TPA: low molecular weight protein-tyrosine-phosphatase [Jatrophihabitantaceae bacterium]|nr:low molecular weight protein-tyrosine-phosphatase [Jatrophihabitantaceae bacterium]
MSTRVLFVCMGNICRSPTAEGVMRHLVAEAGLDGDIDVDSAGTGDWHAGDPPDRRATAAARARGVELSGSARQVTPADFDEYDLIVALDERNLRDLRRIAPPGAEHKLRLLDTEDVPDPYYGGSDHFDAVFDQVERAYRKLLDELRQA